MPFGKYKGWALERVPEDYLIWVLENCERIRPTLRAAIRGQLGLEPGAQQETPKPPTACTVGRGERLAEAMRRWRRDVTLRWHPDLPGGGLRVMQALNEACDKLANYVDGASWW